MNKTFTRHFFGLLALLFWAHGAMGQGATCGAAVALTLNAAGVSGTITSTTNTAGTPSCIASNSFLHEGWYSFTLASTSDVVVTGVGNNRNLLIQVFSGACGSLTEIGCANATTVNGGQTETVSISGLAAATYFIRVLNVAASGTTLNLTSIAVTATAGCATAAIPATEGFNTAGTSTFPTCWIQQTVTGSSNLTFETTSTLPTASPQEGTRFVKWNSFTITNGNQTRLRSLPVTTTGTASVDVDFQWYHSTDGGAGSYLTEGVQVQYSTNGTTWTNAGSLYRRYDAVAGWSKKTLTLPAGAGNQATLYVGFLFTSNAGYNSYLDAAEIKASPSCLPPSALTASSILATSATVSWTAPVTSPLNYNWEVRTSGAGGSGAGGLTASGTATAPTVSASATGLTANTAYNLYVRTNCTGGLGTSSWAGPFAFTTACSAPSAQATSLVLTPSGTSVSVSYTAATGSPTGYLVVRSTSSTLSSNPVNGTTYSAGNALGGGTVVYSGTALTTNNTGLSNATQYYYFVFTYNSTPCPIVYNTTSPLTGNTTTCPATPTTLASTPLATSAGLSWGAVTGAVTYTLEWRITAGVYASITGIPTNSYNLTGLAANTSYQFRVTAVGAVCNSGVSTVSNFTTACASITTFPSVEPFATYLPSTCWVEGDLGTLAAGPTTISATASDWIADGYLNVGATGAAAMNIDAATGSEWIISPTYDIPATGYRVKYNVGATQYNATTAPTTPWEADDFVELLVSTTGTTNWTILRTYNSGNVPSHLGQEDASLLDAYAGQSVRFAFRAFEGASNGSADIDFFIDNFTVELVPSCVQPTALTAPTVGSTTATVSWTAPGSGGTPASYNWEVRTSGAGGSGATGLTTSGTTTHPTVSASVTGLTANTAYNLYVRTDCGGAGTSTWAGPFAFTTPCGAISAFNENFDAVTTPNLPNCWSKILRGASIASSTVGTSTVSPNSGANSVRLYNSSAGASDDIILVSPSLSNLNAGTHQLRFYASNITTSQDLQVGTVNNTTAGATFTVFQAVDITNTYAEYTVNFGAYAGSDTYIAIRRLTTSTASTVYVDDIIWEAAPTCLPPISLATPAIGATTATASWAAPASTTPATYNWEVRTSGAGGSGAAGLTTSGSTTAPTVTASVTGLTASTSYNLYVRTNCTGGSGSSTWAGPFAFTTSCIATNVPYVQNFETAVVPAIPTCNSRVNAGAGNDWVTVNNPGAGFTSNTLRYGYDFTDPANAYFFTQGINLTAGSTYRLSYRYGNSSTLYTERMRVYYGTSPSSAAMTTQLANHTGISSATPVSTFVDFVAPSTGVFYMGFHARSTANQGNLMLDDISLDVCLATAPSAAVLTSPSNASSVCPTGVTLAWNAPSTLGCNAASGYDVYLSTASNPVTLVSSNQAGTSYNAGTLTASTTYYWKVIPRNASGASVAPPTIYSFTTTAGTATTAPLSDNFEANCVTWNYVNATNNRWFIGTSTANGGTKSMYVTNDAGTTNAYTGSSASVTHVYTDVIIPAGVGCISFGFDWKAIGEYAYSDEDNMKVFVTPTSVTPVANTEVAVGYKVGDQWYNDPYVGTAVWKTVNIDLPASAAGTTQRFIFSWKTGTSGTYNPPAAIDNFVVRASSGAAPSGPASTPAPTAGATLSDCIAPTLSWVAPLAVNCDAPSGYDVYLSTANPPMTKVSDNQGLNSYTVDGSSLAASTTYYWQIVPRNGSGSVTKTSCPVWSFTTNAGGIADNTPSITDGFEGACSAWTIVNGSQTNKWTVGTVTKRTAANSMYITNDAGVSNAYTTSSSSVVHFYRDIVFPAGQCYTLTFYYKGQGESTFDYLRAYLVPTTTVPQAGSLLSSGQIGATYNLQAAYTLATINFDPSVAGTTQRLVFTWRNDGSGGTNPPISIDDIAITASALSAPTAAATLVTPTIGASGLCGAPTMTWTAPSLPACSAPTGYDVYLQTTNGPFVTPVSTNQAATTYTSGTPLSAGTYYWKVVPRNSTGAYAIASCPTWSFSVGAGTADNETACLAFTLPLGVNLGGNNSCANGTGEPAAPGGWTGGTLNTVWYKVVVPASGSLKIRTTLGTLTDTQIQLFSATACGGTFTSVANNNDAPACGSTTYKNSQITATGLTVGATYYIRVDGANGLVGTFNIMAVDGSGNFPTSAGQACSAMVPVCNSTMNIGNPGYQGIGYECDFSAAGCLSSGERGSVWYRIPVNADGQLSFSIVPNDYDGVTYNETDYDFAVWKIVGSGAVPCASISTGASAPTPLRCNYNPLGVTGLTADGNAPAEYPGFDGAYETSIDALAGEEYVLVISNFTNSTSGFTIAFDDVSPLDYPTAASVNSVTWTGSIDTDWFKPENWGGCTIPTATIDAQISPAAANQPIVTAKATCKNLVINLGATVTITTGGEIDIHGDYTNSGVLSALNTTNMTFKGTAAQSLNGNLINESALPNLIITKGGGSVTQNQDAEIAGNFVTTSGTSAYNANGKKLSLAGNMSISGTSFTPGASQTLEFNGTTDQTYTNLGEIGNVIVNNTGTAGTYINLASNMTLNNSSTLTFTTGSIKTSASYEVVVKNRASAAVVSATSSYVWGYMRRYINTTGSYDFPMGIAFRHMANVNFTAATTIDNLRARFMATSAFGSPSAAVIAEATVGCVQPTYNQDGGKINSGAWEISAFDAALGSITGDGTYSIALSATGFTNAGKYATVAKNGALAGTRSGCSDPSSGAITVTRTGLTGFSEFDIVQATDGVLPVTITNLNAVPLGKSIGLYWATAQERNNHHFEVLRSKSKSGDMEKIGEVISLGNSQQRQNYRFEDTNVEAGVTYYYALRQIDNDGVDSYTHKVKAALGISSAVAAKIYPNPTEGQSSLELLVPTAGKVQVVITDLLGHAVYKSDYELNAGVQTIGVESAKFTSGAYHVTIIGENLYENLKLVKVE